MRTLPYLDKVFTQNGISTGESFFALLNLEQIDQLSTQVGIINLGNSPVNVKIILAASNDGIIFHNTNMQVNMTDSDSVLFCVPICGYKFVRVETKVISGTINNSVRFFSRSIT